MLSISHKHTVSELKLPNSGGVKHYLKLVLDQD